MDIWKKGITFAALFDQKHVVRHLGSLVEWSITPVLKTGVPRGTGGSNPSASAKESKGKYRYDASLFVITFRKGKGII